MQKIVNGKTPSYLTKLIKKSTIRLDSKNLITPKSRIDLYQTSLAFSGSELWNKLPNELKKLTSLYSFKKRVYEHLLKKTKKNLYTINTNIDIALQSGVPFYVLFIFFIISFYFILVIFLIVSSFICI